MNIHQTRAVRYHCRLAIESAHPRFAYLHSELISIVLSVNSGYE